MNVKLNIGGTLFETTKDTLIKIPYFANLFESFDNFDEPIFIDQDGTDFKHILNWARCPDYLIPYYVPVKYWLLDESIKEKKPEPHIPKLCLKCGDEYSKENLKYGCERHGYLEYSETIGKQCRICGSTCYLYKMSGRCFHQF